MEITAKKLIMCGFVGIFHKTENNLRIPIKKILKSIVHRGPDNSSIVELENNSFLAHCRLSIIDLSKNGNQPMEDESGRYSIIYNGEVYNFKEIKKELIKQNYKFFSKTDTEVILKAFICWGESFIKKLNGMFAFVILDKKKKTLTICRDRYGIKPLYYFLDGKKILISSEIKGILNYPNFKRKLDYSSFVQYFTFQNNFTDTTFFDGIKSFPNASLSVFNLKEWKLSSSTYWRWNFSTPNKHKSEAEYIYKIKNLIKRAVDLQMVGDVNISGFLSSGFDSSLICKFAADKDKHFKTYTVGFISDKNKYSQLDETKDARDFSKILGTVHKEFKVSHQHMEESLDELTYHLENPRAGQCYPNYFASKLASSHSKVVLSGLGSDEIFGGYPWRYFGVKKNTDFNDFINLYFNIWQRITDQDEQKRIFLNNVKNESIDTFEIFKSKFNHNEKKINYVDSINASLNFEANTFLQALLAVEDKLSMASSIELRLPYLDNNLVDFVQKVPVKFKLGNLKKFNIKINENAIGPKNEIFYQQNKSGKLIIRKLMKDFFDKSSSERLKKGFTGPDEDWFRNQSFPFIKKILLNSKQPIYELLNFKEVKKIILRHKEKKENKRLFIWSLLQANQMLKTFNIGL